MPLDIIGAYEQHAKELLEAFIAATGSPKDQLEYVKKNGLTKPDSVAEIDWNTDTGWKVAIREHIMGKG